MKTSAESGSAHTSVRQGTEARTRLGLPPLINIFLLYNMCLDDDADDDDHDE